MVDRSAATLLLCGYYGEKNLGDDALLTVLLKDLPADCRLLITARDVNVLHQLCPSATWVDRRSLKAVVAAVGKVDAVVLGGGSLLQDSTSFRSLIYYLALIATARLRRRPVLLWGQGLGPLHRPISRWLVRVMLPLCSSASWRDQTSFLLAKCWAPKLLMDVAPDPVWQLPQREWVGRGAIVLSWRPTPLLDSQGWRCLLDALAAVADRLDAPVCWLAFHQHQDAPLLSSLRERKLIPESLVHRSHTVVPTELNTVFEQVRTSRLVIPMRLHALVLARLAGCPIAALSYDPKVAAAADMAGIPWVPLAQLPDSATLAEQWYDQADQPPLKDDVERIRQDVSRHGQRLRQGLQLLRRGLGVVR